MRILSAFLASGAFLCAQGADCVLINEITFEDGSCIEIWNCGSGTADLSAATLDWKDNNGTATSTPLGVTLAPNQVVVVFEPNGCGASPPPPHPGIPALPPLSPGGGPVTVALRDGVGVVVDEVRVSSVAGGHPGWTFGGTFRGIARRGLISTAALGGVERIQGLDSNSGADWTDQRLASLGRENRSSGPRGTDPVPVANVLISEIDPSPDFLELYNGEATAVDLKEWRILCSPQQASGTGSGHAHQTIQPFPNTFQFPAGTFLVLGNGPTAPAELPGGVPYVDLAAAGGGLLPFQGAEFDCALYDRRGRLVDLVRATGAAQEVVHNYPRAPSHWSDFVGGARRDGQSPGGDRAIGRVSLTLDTDSGADWRPVFTRTMGTPNGGFAAGPGHGHPFDVRLNEGDGDGLVIILNAGSGAAGYTYSMLLSVGHANGQGPFFGLGPDALINYLLLQGVPPWTGVLDQEGSARIDFDPGLFPPGIDLDTIWLLQDPVGLIAARTLVLEYDT